MLVRLHQDQAETYLLAFAIQIWCRGDAASSLSQPLLVLGPSFDFAT